MEGRCPRKTKQKINDNTSSYCRMGTLESHAGKKIMLNFYIVFDF